MLRNHYYLPTQTSSIICEFYLNGIREQNIYCPKYSDLKPLPCPDPPGKDYLIAEVLKYAAKKQLNMGFDDKKLPDKQWLIQVLSIFNSTHEIFQKDYLPPIKTPSLNEQVVDNSDNFFTGLPKLYKAKDVKAMAKLQQYKQCKTMSRIKKLKDKRVDIEQSIQLLGDLLQQEEKIQTKVKVDKDEFIKMKEKIREYEKNAREEEKVSDRAKHRHNKQIKDGVLQSQV